MNITRKEDANKNNLSALALNDVTERKKVEKEITEEKEKTESYLNIVGSIVLVLDSRFRITLLNKKGYEILGYEEGELTGKDWLRTCLPKEIRKEIRETFTKYRHDENQFQDFYENPILTKTGETRTIRWHNSVLHNERGRQIGTLSSGEDITERKKVEDELLSAEIKFRTIFENVHDIITYVDNRGKIIDVNDRIEDLLGYKKEEIVGKNFVNLGLIKFSDTPKFLKLFLSGIRKGKAQSIMQLELKHKNGSKVDFEVGTRLIKNKKGKTVGVINIFRDITERKKTEEALEQERDTLEDITKNIGAGLVIINKDYRVIWANKNLKQLYGRLENPKCYSIFDDGGIICPGCGVKKIFKGASFDSREYFSRSLHEKGRPCWFELIVTPIKDKDGKITAALELTVDITEKKLLQDKLAVYSQKLEKIVAERTEQLQQTQSKLVKSERLAAIGELAGMVGHDLRNPLSGIKNAAFYLKNKQDKCTEQDKTQMLEIIDRAINHADKIINDLLDYSRDIRLELSECSSHSLLKESLIMIDVPDRIKIIDKTSDKHKLKGDKARLTRVFVNVIKNAMDAIPRDGSLKIRSRKLKNTVNITFTDAGIGMSKETLDKLFMPLVTTKAQGMGFGLAICKRIIDAHHGKITVESTLGEGTTITISLLIKQEKQLELEEKWITLPEQLLLTKKL
jgi:PAS domain S-box-containing protein